jgi:hypothetical protein
MLTRRLGNAAGDYARNSMRAAIIIKTSKSVPL